jgi:hypothetical protein
VCRVRVGMGYHVVDIVSLFGGKFSGCSGTRLRLIVYPEFLPPEGRFDGTEGNLWVYLVYSSVAVP